MNDKQRARDLFILCYRLSHQERASRLDSECGVTYLRQSVQELLDAFDRGGVEPGLRDEALHLIVPDKDFLPHIDGFEMRAEIGRGGMGIVYLATELALDRDVAIKAISGLGTVDQLRAEALATANLRHPGIVPIYAITSSEEQPFVVMAYIKGQTLRDLIKSDLKPGPATRQRWAVDLIAQVAEAVHHAHENGCIHSDIKPSNILIDKGGQPYITDFGIARSRATSDDDASRLPGGTYAYMSTEQAAGEYLDARTDIASLGIIFYELLCGEHPYRAATPLDTLDNARIGGAVPVRQHNRAIARDLETICAKAMAADPDHRYQRASQLADDLRCFLDDKPILAQPPRWEYRLISFVRRHRKAGTLLCIELISILVGAAFFSRIRTPMARLNVRTTDSMNAQAYWRPLDMETNRLSAPIRLGNTPLSRQVLPGHGRLVVRAGDDVAEYALELETGARTEVDAVLRPTEEVTSNMVLIQPYGVVDAPFWIDVHEVTNEQYREFTDATGYQTPPLWTHGDFPESWNDLPVVGVTYFDATAYAQWAGKRLPTVEEWELAAQGPEGSPFPWPEPRWPKGGWASTEWTDESRDSFIADLKINANAHKGQQPRFWFNARSLPTLSLTESEDRLVARLVTETENDPKIALGALPVDRRGIVEACLWHNQDKSYYLSNVVPADSLTPKCLDVTSRGLLHTVGNVAEWTESIYRPPTNTESGSELSLRFIKSDGWGRDPIAAIWALNRSMGDFANNQHISRGLRCARSEPPTTSGVQPE